MDVELFNLVLRKLRSFDLKVCVLTAWDRTLLALIKVQVQSTEYKEGFECLSCRNE